MQGIAKNQDRELFCIYLRMFHSYPVFHDLLQTKQNFMMDVQAT